MKFSLFKNDRSTWKDELMLFGIIVLCLLVGILLVSKAPAIGIISGELTQAFGVAWIILAIMLIPCLIYRLLTND